MQSAPDFLGSWMQLITRMVGLWRVLLVAVMACDANVVDEASVQQAVSGTGTGLYAHHFDNSDLTALIVTRVDPTVDFAYGNGSPSPSIAASNFSSRWEGEVEARYSETYRFYTLSDDGVRLWVNGVQLVNDWTGHGPIETFGDIALVAGQRHP